jgi:accessory gene regulator B
MTGLLKRITDSWEKSGIIEKTDEDIYEYGLDLIVSTIFNITAVLVTAVFIDKLLVSALLLAAVIPLQSYGGGYHAVTHLRCFLIMYIGWWCVVFILPLINAIAAVIIAVMAVPIVYAVAPVPHVNVKMSSEHRLKLRKVVRVIVAVIALLSLILIGLVPDGFGMGIALSTGLGISALSMLTACVKKRFFT